MSSHRLGWAGTEQQGMSLVEIMVALLIGLVLAGAVMLIYLNSNHAFGVHTNVASIQENGRFAMQALQEDVRLAGYWGLNYEPDTIKLAEPIHSHDKCALGWLMDVSRPVESANNTNRDYTDCVPDQDYLSDTDILVIRRASSNPVADSDIAAGAIYLRTSLTSGSIFIADQDGAVDAGLEVDQMPVRNYPLLTHVYYLRPWSRTRNDGVPTLIREAVGGTTMRAEPLVEYVEDLQVTFGLDTDGDGSVDRCNDDGMSPETAADVLTVTVEILVRAPNVEAGYENTRSYQLGDKEEFEPKDGFRRQLFRQSIFLRNLSRPVSA